VIRLFVAIPFPLDMRQRLALLSGGIPGARWTAADNFHLTVRFIGEVDGHGYDDVVDALAQVRAPRFDLVLSRIDHFGKGDKARVLWIGVEKNPALLHLHDRVESALVRAGLEPEGRKYSPHVTLARLDRAPSGRLGAFVQANHLVRVGPLSVDRFVLFSSWSRGEGPIYELEAEYPLDPPVSGKEGLNAEDAEDAQRTRRK
jgi:2'-5' RNA ligase